MTRMYKQHTIVLNTLTCYIKVRKRWWKQSSFYQIKFLKYCYFSKLNLGYNVHNLIKYFYPIGCHFFFNRWVNFYWPNVLGLLQVLLLKTRTDRNMQTVEWSFELNIHFRYELKYRSILKVFLVFFLFETYAITMFSFIICQKRLKTHLTCQISMSLVEASSPTFRCRVLYESH